MQRRNFLRLGALTAIATVVPSAYAEDYRKTKPTVWTATKIDEAIVALYGTSKSIASGVTLDLPEVATNGASVPIHVSSELSAKSVAVFQDTNPEAAVAVFTVHENSIIDYKFNVKLRSDGTPITITAIVEGTDGKLYSDVKSLIVPMGTCDG